MYPFQNGGNTHYELRKSIKDPVALMVDRYQYSNNGVVGFEYNVALNFWHDPQTGLIHWGDTDEIEPAPSWFYPDTDHHVIQFIMLRQVSNIQ